MEFVNNFLSTSRNALVIAAFSTMIFGCSANRNVSRNDVQEEVQEAKQATDEAREETKEAVEARKEYTSDSKEARIEAIEERLDEIDENIEELQEVAKESTNAAAVENMNKAMVNMETEKTNLRQRIDALKTMDDQGQDWGATYTEVDEALKKIESQLTDLSQSLK